MAIASISAWLLDPNKTYLHGKLLFDQYGDNKTLSALFNSGSTNFHLSKLVDVLSKINLQANLEPKPIIVADFSPEVRQAGKPEINYKSAPEQILQIRERKNVQYAQARKLHESIRVMDSQKHRLEAGLQLLNLMDDVAEAWEIVDAWNEKGIVTEQQQKAEALQISKMNIHELIREKGNLSSNISKDKKRISSAGNEKDKLKYTQSFEERKSRLALVLERIENYAV